MLVGDKIMITPTFGDLAEKKVAATVVYIHPARRYYVAEYLSRDGKPLRESFPFRHRSGK